MKYISYLIFFIFIALLLYFLKNALEPSKEVQSITGTEKCGECHSLKNIGDQNQAWKNSKHSGAYTVLFSSKAIDYNKSKSLNPPDKEEKCLKCHTTAYFLKGIEQSSSFNIDEGVGCEACHGAGSVYSPSEIMKDESVFERYGGIKGSEETCLKCHNAKGNKSIELKDDTCPFQQNDFIFKSEFEKIKHPVNPEMMK